MVATAILDPEILPLVDALPFRAFDPGADLEAVRKARLAETPPLSDAVDRVDHVVSDDPYVVVRVHRRRGVGGALPCVYSIHGGGYILGTYEMDDLRFDRWCQHFGCIGVSVEYRLAPETPYPGPLEDCYAGLRWTYEHAATIGIDPGRIGIAGVSAGGGLAAGLALLARDRAEVPVQFQLLECPMIDDRQITPSSQLDDLLIWSKGANTFGWQSYLGSLYGASDVPPYAAAARATDLAGLPPALVIVGGADGFRDENIDYAMRLGHAGVSTELHVLPGGPHGLAMFAGTSIAKRWTSLVNDWLGRQLAS